MWDAQMRGFLVTPVFLSERSIVSYIEQDGSDEERQRKQGSRPAAATRLRATR